LLQDTSSSGESGNKGFISALCTSVSNNHRITRHLLAENKRQAKQIATLTVENCLLRTENAALKQRLAPAAPVMAQQQQELQLQDNIDEPDASGHIDSMATEADEPDTEASTTDVIEHENPEQMPGKHTSQSLIALHTMYSGACKTLSL
jgi:regulator of replication initiation timing